ncbi:MAG: hypothetical protein AAFX99_18230 [Myxococcota bacterium]
MSAQSHRKTWIGAGIAVFLLVAVVALIAVQTSTLSDLRPDELRRSGVTPEAEAKGRALLERMTEAHGGMATWRGHKTMEVELTDTWFKAVERLAVMPWPESGQSLKLTMLLGQDISRLEFSDGPLKGESWGVQHWAPYRVKAGETQPLFPQEDWEVTFWVPTVAYFMEAPFRLGEANVVAYVGERTIGGEVFEGVFLSWGSDAPQDKVDQYIAWIGRDSGRLTYLEYTVRDILPSITAVMHYRDYKEVQGIAVPMNMGTSEGVGMEDTGHRFDVASVAFGGAVAESFLVPDPSQRRSKH